jgi:hypothetical protein
MPPTKATSSLRESLAEIAQEISIIESNYPRLMALKDEPEKYTDGIVFHSVWLNDLYEELKGFLGSADDLALVSAPMTDEAEAAEIQALIARTDKMPGLFPEEVDRDISKSPESFVSGFRQEALKTQFAYVRLQEIHSEIIEHNICVKNLRCSVTRIIMSSFEGELKEIAFALDQISKALHQLPTEVVPPANKYLELMESRAVRVVQVAQCIFEVIAESLPPMNARDVADPSKIGHKSKLDQRCAHFYRKRQDLTELASNLHQELSRRMASKHRLSYSQAAASSMGLSCVGGPGTQRKGPGSLDHVTAL